MKYSPDAFVKIKAVCDAIQAEIELSDISIVKLKYEKVRAKAVDLDDFKKVLRLLEQREKVIKFLGEKPIDKKFPDLSGTYYSIEVLKNFYDFIENDLQIRIKQDHKEESTNFWIDDDKVFKLKTSAGDLKPINFSPKSEGGTDTYYLMKSLVWLLKKYGANEGEWFQAEITRDDIVKFIRKEFRETVNNDWLKNTKHNLKTMIPENWNGYLELSNFDMKKGAYVFRLKMPN